MTKILGLDLGTNSIGWAVVEQTDGKITLIKKGGHIFSEAVDTADGSFASRAAVRTRYRGSRRLKFRRKLRKYETLKVLIEANMCPLESPELERWRHNYDPVSKKHRTFKDYPTSHDFLNWLATKDEFSENPYVHRAAAINGKIPPYDLGRAFYHMAQRRGFLSNRVGSGDDSEGVDALRLSIFEKLEEQLNDADLINEMRELLFPYLNPEDKKDTQPSATNLAKSLDTVINTPCSDLTVDIENILNKRENLGPVKGGIANLSQEMNESGSRTLGEHFHKLYGPTNRIRGRHTGREEHYEKEFQLICKVQEIEPGLQDRLQNAIFYTRPLKSQKGLVGRCPFEKDKPRIQVSHPAYEEYRALSYINNIRVTDKGERRDLSELEKEAIWPKFLRKSKPTFEFTEIEECVQKISGQVEFKTKPYAKVSGCPVTASLRTIFGEDWVAHLRQRYKKERSVNGVKSDEQIVNDIWHVLVNTTDDGQRKKWAAVNLCDDVAEEFSKIRVRREYASLSLKAVQKILPYLRKGLIYSHAVFMANLEKVLSAEIWADTSTQAEIETMIRQVITSNFENRRMDKALNSILENLRDEYEGGWHRYQLGDEGRAILRQQLISSLGEHYFRSLGEAEQRVKLSWAEQRIKEQLAKAPGQRFVKSLRMDEEIIQKLQERFPRQELKIEKLWHPSSIDIYPPAETDAKSGKRLLGSPMVESIKNPMAMRSLHQLRHLVNALIREEVIDDETHVHIELARELNSRNQRIATERWQRRREAENEVYRGLILELFNEERNPIGEPSDTDYKKIRLWHEQQMNGMNPLNAKEDLKCLEELYHCWREQRGICFYTGDTISMAQLFLGHDFELEHTIPRSRSFDNSLANLTVASKSYNNNIKGNRIPSELADHEDILGKLGHWRNLLDKYRCIYESRRKPRGIETPELKDRRIQEMYLAKMDWEYWRDKLDRFTRKDTPDGFKNSQLVDTGIITKYARAYLKSVFPVIHTVKGSAVAEFRVLWGLQQRGTKKDRSVHTHHTIDAIVIACMTKKKYDLLAKYYRAEETEDSSEAARQLSMMRPWKGFAKDVRKAMEGVLVTHHVPDHMGATAKRKLRHRGKIQHKATYKKDGQDNYLRDGNGKKIVEEHIYLRDSKGDKVPQRGRQIPSSELEGMVEGVDYFNDLKLNSAYMYVKRRFILDGKEVEKVEETVYRKEPVLVRGESARASLHKDTFFGKIKVQQLDKNGAARFDKDGRPMFEEKHVIRKQLSDLKPTNIKDIVDPMVRDKVRLAMELAGSLGKAISIGIWMKDKKIPIKKVRMFAPVNAKLEIQVKAHRDKSKHSHKQNLIAKNDEVIGVRLQEGSDSNPFPSKVEFITPFDRYAKEAEETGHSLNSESLLMKGDMVVFFQNTPDEIDWQDATDVRLRLYRVQSFDQRGSRVKFEIHNNAIPDSALKGHLQNLHGASYEDVMFTGMKKFEIDKCHTRLYLSKAQMKFIVLEKSEYNLSLTGGITVRTDA